MLLKRLDLVSREFQNIRVVCHVRYLVKSLAHVRKSRLPFALYHHFPTKEPEGLDMGRVVPGLLKDVISPGIILPGNVPLTVYALSLTSALH